MRRSLCLNVAVILLLSQNALYATPQTSIINKANVRVSSLTNATGIDAGDKKPKVGVWLGSIANIAKQKQHHEGLNTGYRLRSLGGIIGVDTKCRDKMFGLALAYTNASIHPVINHNFTTRTISYYALLYGSKYYQSLFAEWILAGSTNTNTATRGVDAIGNDLLVDSEYHGWQAGAKLNVGNFTDWCAVRFAHIISLQYSHLQQLAYNARESVNTLVVHPTPGQNILTIGTGLRFSLPGCDPWLTGSRELRAIVTYDLTQAKSTTFANFMFSSPNYGIINHRPKRFGYQLGADFAFTFCEFVQIQFSYDYVGSSGYYDNAAEIKLKLLF